MGTGYRKHIQKKLILKSQFFNLNRYINMKSPNDMLKEIKNLLGMELSEEVKEEIVQEEVQVEAEATEKVDLAQMKLENGTVLEAEAFEADNEVFIVTEDERIALPVGEYALEDGKILVCEEEGMIKEIKEAIEEAPIEEEMAEESSYATKEELAEVKSMIEEIKAMLEPKEEMEEQLKEELSKPATEPLKHSPENEEEKELKYLWSQKRAMNTRDRVFQKISNFK